MKRLFCVYCPANRIVEHVYAEAMGLSPTGDLLFYVGDQVRTAISARNWVSVEEREPTTAAPLPMP